MPQAFEDCVSSGGQVRTKTLPGNRYIHICYIKGKAYPGDPKQKEEDDHSYPPLSQKQRIGKADKTRIAENKGNY